MMGVFVACRQPAIARVEAAGEERLLPSESVILRSEELVDIFSTPAWHRYGTVQCRVSLVGCCALIVDLLDCTTFFVSSFSFFKSAPLCCYVSTHPVPTAFTQKAMAQPFADSCDSIAARLRQANADLAHIARAFDDEFNKRYDDKVVMAGLHQCQQQHLDIFLPHRATHCCCCSEPASWSGTYAGRGEEEQSAEAVPHTGTLPAYRHARKTWCSANTTWCKRCSSDLTKPTMPCSSLPKMLAW